MQGRDWVINDFKDASFETGAYSCIYKSMRTLIKIGEIVGVKRKGKKITVTHYTATKLPLAVEVISEPVKVEKKEEFKEWIYSGWFPVPNFKVKQVYKHDGWN
jgi:hypothetical protein